MKKILSVFLAVIILSFSMFALAEEGYGGNNNQVNDQITDSVNWLESSYYNLSNNFVLKIQPNTTVTAFKNNFVNSANITVSDTGIIKTGGTVYYSTAPQEIYTTVVYGDVTCDGLLTVSDITAALNIIAGNGTYSEASQKAADIDLSGKVNVIDVNIIRNYILMGE